jgi:hypothetical protein
MKRLALAGVVLMVAPSLAHAVSIDLSINTATYTYASFDPSGNPVANGVTGGVGNGVSNTENVGFWTATTTFDLTSTNVSLGITDLAGDDRVVAELNGVVVGAAGIFGPGPGMFIFTPTGSQVPQDFSGEGGQGITVTSPFVVGTNTLELIVNNTGSGIYGGLGTGTTSIFFSGVVSSTTPEPAPWALMLIGFGAMGAALRIGRRASTATA